jgi:hypothetical protein
MPNMTEERPGEVLSPPAETEKLRQQAIKQIERKRRFKRNTFVSSLGMILLTAIWAMSEYHNAGGWPTDGFSQSSSIPNVWNIWIIYPFLAWVVLTAAAAWDVYVRKPITEREIRREIDRQVRG